METFAFVDTNLLLHYRLFTEVDWHKELGVADVTLVLAPVVVSEVDDHKWSGSSPSTWMRSSARSSELRETSSSAAPPLRNTLRLNDLSHHTQARESKVLILLVLRIWLLRLDSNQQPSG